MTHGAIAVITGEAVDAFEKRHDVAIAAFGHAVLDQIRQLNRLAHRCSMPFSVRERCGHCRNVADIPFVSTQLFCERSPRAPREDSDTFPRMLFQELGEDDPIDAYAVGICPICAKPSLILYQTKRKSLPNIREALGEGPGLFGGSSLITLVSVYPVPPQPDIHASWPPKAATYFKDAQMMLEEGRSPALVITACRSVLDVATKELGGLSGTLAKRIDELRGRGVITQSLSDWAHELRLDGNAAVHEIEGTAETAAELVAFLRVFMQVAFTLPAEIEAKRARSNPPSS